MQIARASSAHPTTQSEACQTAFEKGSASTQSFFYLLPFYAKTVFAWTCLYLFCISPHINMNFIEKSVAKSRICMKLASDRIGRGRTFRRQPNANKLIVFFDSGSGGGYQDKWQVSGWHAVVVVAATTMRARRKTTIQYIFAFRAHTVWHTYSMACMSKINLHFMPPDQRRWNERHVNLDVESQPRGFPRGYEVRRKGLPHAKWRCHFFFRRWQIKFFPSSELLSATKLIPSKFNGYQTFSSILQKYPSISLIFLSKGLSSVIGISKFSLFQ